MAISRIGTDGIDQTSSQQIGGISVGKGGGNVATNTAVGASALAANTTGGFNAAIGTEALASNTEGASNVALGRRAVYTNTTGSENVGIGGSALRSNTTGSYNAAVGHVALYSNTTGANNTSLGYGALYLNTTASNNTAVGYQAGYSNTTGTTSTVVGYKAGYTNQTGNYNTFIGYQAGYSSNVNGNAVNTCIGHNGGYSLTTGTRNTFIGCADAGFYVTTGSKNTILGGYTGNQGGLDIRTSSNNIVLSDGDGNPKLYYQASNTRWILQDQFWPTGLRSGAGTNAAKYNTSTGELTYDTSSARYKDNIRDSVYGLSHVMQMRSAQFEYKDDGRSDVGLIAEELQPIIPELVGVNKEGQADSVSYDRMVSVLVKAIQELKAEFDAYKEAHP